MDPKELVGEKVAIIFSQPIQNCPALQVELIAIDTNGFWFRSPTLSTVLAKEGKLQEQVANQAEYVFLPTNRIAGILGPLTEEEE